MTFSFTFAIADADVAARLCAAITELISQSTKKTASDQVGVPASSPTSPDGTDESNTRQIVDALAYRPLTPIQLLFLREWNRAEDWTPVTTLHRRILDAGLARNREGAVRQVRAELSGLANRMTRKVRASTKERAKLGALVQIRREDGSASYRLHDDGRKAVNIILKV
jgi:hypothetical protein